MNRIMYFDIFKMYFTVDLSFVLTSVLDTSFLISSLKNKSILIIYKQLEISTDTNFSPH